MLFTLLLLIGSVFAGRDWSRACDDKVTMGDSNCKGANATIKYFFDREMNECYTFLYHGCNKGHNHYDTEEECIACRPADMQICGGGEKETGTCADFPEKIECAKGSKCLIGGMGVGICCDLKQQDSWTKELNPKCSKGELVKRDVWYGKQIVFGRNCDHRFCPSDSECISGKILSYCCRIS